MRKFLAVFLVFLPILALAQAETETPRVVAVVNGEEITRDQLDSLTNITGIVLSIYRQYPHFAQLLLSSEEGKALIRAYERDVLESLITWRLIVQEARNRGLTVPEETLQDEVDKTIQGIMERNGLTEEELADILQKQRGQSLEEFRAQVRHDVEERLLYDLLKEEVAKGVSVSEEEIERYYEENRNSFTDEEGNVKPLDEVADEIRSALIQRKRDDRWRELLAELRAAAEVEIRL